jgi:hypothetical protein
MRFSDLVAAPKHKALAAAQAPAPVAAPAPAAPAAQGVTAADLRAAAHRFSDRALKAHRAGRSDDFAVRNSVAAEDLAAKLESYGSFVSAKQAEFAAKLVGWSLPREQQSTDATRPAPTARPATWAALQPFARLSAGRLEFRKKNAEPLWWVLFDGALVGKAEDNAVIGFSSKIRAAGIDASEVRAALDAFEADPVGALKAHGLATGSCGCCGRELTDPQSIALGIGPICAGKLGF